MLPFTLRFLTPAEYGVFAIVGDMLIWLGIMQLGTSASFGSRAAQLIGRKEKQSLSTLTSTAFTLQIVAAISILLVGGVISLNIEHLLKLEAFDRGLAFMMFILVLGASIRITAQVFSALLMANKQIHIDNMLAIGVFILKTVLTVALLLMGLKLMALAWSALAAATVLAIVSFYRVKKQMPEVHITPRLFKKEHAKDLLGNGVWFTIGGLAGILILSVDRFIIGMYVSLESVTAFVVTGKLYYVASMVHAQIFNMMRPYIGQLHGQGNTRVLLNVYNAAFSVSMFTSASMACVIYVVNHWFINWWVGPELYLSDTISFLFALNFMLQSSVLPNRVLLASTLFNPKMHSVSRLVEGVVNVAVSLALVGVYREAGVLFASVISSLAFSAIALNYLSQNYFAAYFSSASVYLSYVMVVPLVMLYAAESMSSVYFILAVVLLLFFGVFLSYKGRSNSEVMKIYDQLLSKVTKKSEV